MSFYQLVVNWASTCNDQWRNLQFAICNSMELVWDEGIGAGIGVRQSQIFHVCRLRKQIEKCHWRKKVFLLNNCLFVLFLLVNSESFLWFSVFNYWLMIQIQGWNEQNICLIKINKYLCCTLPYLISFIIHFLPKNAYQNIFACMFF